MERKTLQTLFWFWKMIRLGSKTPSNFLLLFYCCSLFLPNILYRITSNFYTAQAWTWMHVFTPFSISHSYFLKESSLGSYSELKWNMKNFYLLQILLMSTPFYSNGKSEMNDSKVKLPPNTKKTNAFNYVKASDWPSQKIIWYKTIR